MLEEMHTVHTLFLLELLLDSLKIGTAKRICKRTESHSAHEEIS
jgi:hypothetical protein